MTAFDAARYRQTIFEALLEARATHGGGRVILKDADGTAPSYDRLVMGSLILGRKLSALAPDALKHPSASRKACPRVGATRSGLKPFPPP